MAVHHFKPTQYYTTIGSHAPALVVEDGDTVVTTTVDAHGQDASGGQVTPPGNPMTGPFYVRGAMPGDTLAVTFDKLTPNRPHGWSRKMVAPNVVEPESVPALPWPADEARMYAIWQVDNNAATVTLVDPADTSVGGLTLPARPMVGCFGAAPADGQAISTATSAEHGGNMDYRGYCEGVTAYLPVFVAGALFHIGDGHALQGDGEIVGTGVEISFDVQFTVRVVKGMRSRWPRGENDEYIFTAGNVRPLDQAVQHATTEMLRWLQDGYGLDAVGSHILMGQCVEYDLGNVYDPAYTMICKMPKRVLPNR
jgi:amidase